MLFIFIVIIIISILFCTKNVKGPKIFKTKQMSEKEIKRVQKFSKQNQTKNKQIKTK
jgi:hypothetical protein